MEDHLDDPYLSQAVFALVDGKLTRVRRTIVALLVSPNLLTSVDERRPFLADGFDGLWIHLCVDSVRDPQRLGDSLPSQGDPVG